MTTITLRQGPTAWLATTTGDGAAEIIDLFGTDTIETAFDRYAPAAMVLAEITRLNPDATITLA